jgi:hypothetical protein
MMGGQHLHQAALMLLLTATALHAQIDRPSGLPDEPVSIVKPSRSDTLTLGLHVASEFDDNALNDNRNKQPNLMTVVEPQVTWALSRARLEWLLRYTNGFAFSQQLSAYNSQSHSLDMQLGFRQTKRLKFSLSNSFLKSTNPFDFFRPTGAAPGTGPSNQPNDFLLTATANRTSEQAGAEVTYALSRHSTVGVDGSFSILRYGAATANQVPLQFLGNESSTGGGIFYSHHVSRRQWARVDYGVQRMVFSGPSSLVQNVFYTHTIAFSPASMFSMFAGPERATSDPPGVVRSSAGFLSVSSTTWHWAGGGTYNWRTARTHLVLGFYHKISSESGLLGAAWLSSATAAWRQRITPRWSVELAGAYDHNRTLDPPRNDLSFIWAAAGVSRTLRQDISVEVKYWRVHQSTDTFRMGSLAADHNRVSISMGYNLKARLNR